MAITREEVLHVARLARLSLPEAEAERLRGQLSAILDYVKQLDRLDTRDVVVDVHAVGARVAQPVAAVAVFDLAVVAGDDAFLVRQHPVVVQCAADAAAVDAKGDVRKVAEPRGMLPYDAQSERHVPNRSWHPLAGAPVQP